MPKKNAKIKVVIDWYLSVESLLKGILDLGRKDSKLGSEVFNNGAFLQEICGMFPQKLGLKLGKVPGKLDKKLEAIIPLISEWRKEAQTPWLKSVILLLLVKFQRLSRKCLDPSCCFTKIKL